jgi:hypothetical protein
MIIQVALDATIEHIRTQKNMKNTRKLNFYRFELTVGNFECDRSKPSIFGRYLNNNLGSILIMKKTFAVHLMHSTSRSQS